MVNYSRSILKRNKLKQKIIFYGFISIVAFIVLGFLLSFFVFAWYGKDLPSPGKLSQTSQNSTVFYDREGKVIYEMYKDKNRVPVDIKDVADNLKKATVAIEDKNFYKHRGVSQTGILRAVLNIFLKRRLEGGSTITQQLIKNVLLTSQRVISRKVREIILAIEVERRYSKDQILEMYLNEAPYGGSYWGVATATSAYFNKSPKNLNLVESAILAGLPQNPSYFSPFIGKNSAWKDRAIDVLRRMREDGYITKVQEKKALTDLDKVKFASPRLNISAPHFIFYVKNMVEEEMGPKIIDTGVKIKTTLALDVQKSAEKIVKDEISKLKDFDVSNAAVVVLDSKTGEILAMVGSYDYNDDKFGKFNAALGLRQPGSALKPFEYGLALEKGYTAASVIMDVKTVFPNQGEKDYIPENYDGKFAGPIQLRFALGNSINIPAVKILAMVGIKDFLQYLSNFGMDTFGPTQENIKRFGLSISLGGGETTLLDLTSSYAVLANGGTKRNLSSFTEISDFNNKKLYQEIKAKEKQIVPEEVAFIISHILSDNNARIQVFGPNSYLKIPGKTVAVKTGTTNDKRDNWAVGYTKKITIGVWVGNNDNTPMNAKIASGITGASPIWYQLMTEVLKKYEDGIIDKPANVEAVQIDAYLGGLPKDGYPNRAEYFIKNSEPKDISPFYKKLKISKSNGKLANDVEIKSGNYEEKDFIVITENDPISVDGKNRWQEAIDAWSREQSDSKYHYPTETSDASADSVIVSIKSPGNQSKVDSNNVEIKAKIASLGSIKNVKIYLNGNEVKNLDGDNKDINEAMSLNDGVYELKITAKNDKDKNGESTIKFGVNKAWDYVSPTNVPTPTLILSPSPTPTEEP